MSLPHTELFEVLTSPSGQSDIQIQLACATVKEHYARTTVAKESRTCVSASHLSPPATNEGDVSGVHEPVRETACATGLRIYEGAHVLSSFVAQFGRALLRRQIDTNAQSDDSYTDRRCTAQADQEQQQPQQSCVVELGCGCGLVGFTAAKTLPGQYIVFTDGSSDCLALVQSSGQAMGVVIQDGTDTAADAKAANSNRTTEAQEQEQGCVGLTYTLQWSEEGLRALHAAVTRRVLREVVVASVPPLHAGQASAWAHDDLTYLAASAHPRRRVGPLLGLVLGSDLMYYRVDVDSFVSTCSHLLNVFEGASGDQSRMDGVSQAHSQPLCTDDLVAKSSALLGNADCNNTSTRVMLAKSENVILPEGAAMAKAMPNADAGIQDTHAEIVFFALAHHMRIANGRCLLAAAARRHGFAIVSVPLTTFLAADVLRCHGWTSLELVLLARRPNYQRILAAESNDMMKPDAACDSDAAASMDVRFVRCLLLHRSEQVHAEVRAGGTNNTDDALIASALTLRDSIARYPPEATPEQTLPVDASAEGDLTSLFM